jgi:cellulose synthase operon protein C
MNNVVVGRLFAPFGLGALMLTLLTGCSSPEDRARSHYERAIKLVSEHENVKALIELKNAVQLKRDMVDAWRAMVQIDEANRDWPRVIADLRTIVEIDSRDISSRLKLGQLLLVASLPDEALLVANAGLDLDENNADLHALKATTKVKLRDQAEAAREAQRALQLDPGNVNALMVLAILKLDGGDANGALSLLEGSSAADAKAAQGDPGLQLLRAKLFERVGDLPRVEATLKTLVEANPQSADYLRLLINFYLEQRRFEEAEKGLRTLVGKDTSDPKAILELVRFLYVTRKSPSAAREELNSHIKAGGAIFPLQIALANMDIADGRPDIAREQLQKLISEADSSEKRQIARLALAQNYLVSSEVEAAARQVADVLTDDPHNAPALKLRALIHLQRSELDAAISDLRNGLNSQPRAVDLMALLGSAYERNGLMELADKQFADATRASNFDPAISVGYAEFLERRGNVSRAEDILGEVVKRQPVNVQALTMLGQIKLARQDWDGASEIAASIRKAGEANLADQIFGTALLGRARYDQAIAVFTAAYDRNPTASQPLNSLVAALQKANKIDEAAALLKSILAKSPQNADALVLLGAIELKRGGIDQARTRFSAAVEAQPKALVGYEALASFHVAQKDYKEAIRVAQAGSKVLPDVASLRLISARASEQTQDYESAISQYQAILDKQPTNLVAANNLASLLLDQTSDPASLKRAQVIAAVLRQSRIPQFKDTLGWASYLQGDYRNALALCEEAAAALPDQAVVRYHLAMSLIALGQSGKASEQLKKALDLAPDQKLADNIRSALEKIGS